MWCLNLVDVPGGPRECSYITKIIISPEVEDITKKPMWMFLVDYVQLFATPCVFSTIVPSSFVRYERFVKPTLVHYFWGTKLP